MEEGKREMPFEVYLALVKHWWKTGKFFELTYLLLTWNLACRTNNVQDLKICHLGWRADSLEIQFGVTKSNQEGVRKENKLVFANPKCSFICPVLALGVYLCTLSKNFSSTDALFPGGTQDDRFGTSLGEAMRTHQFVTLLATFGLQPGDIGALNSEGGGNVSLQRINGVSLLRGDMYSDVVVSWKYSGAVFALQQGF